MNVTTYINQVKDESTRKALQAVFDQLQTDFTLGALSLSSTLSVTGLATLAAGLNTGNGSVKVFYNSEALADDAEFDLPDATQGFALVTNGTEYILAFVDTDGSVLGLNTSANAAVADTDANLCLYDNGTKASVKNRLAGEETVTCLYIYAA